MPSSQIVKDESEPSSPFHQLPPLTACEALQNLATPIPRTLAKEAYSFVKSQIDEGGQAYVVYPVIEESKTQALKAAQKMYEHLSQEVFPQVSVGLMHGRLVADEKEAVMQRFKEGAIKIMVSTTVIEVGVDVPSEEELRRAVGYIRDHWQRRYGLVTVG
jgi:RecG-like helicase